MKCLRAITYAGIVGTVIGFVPNAAADTVNSVVGKWISTNPVAGISGLNTDTISWGTSTGSGQSS